VSAIGELAPALLPTAHELAVDGELPLADKVGYEHKLAVLYAELLAWPPTGVILLNHARRESSRAGQVLEDFRSRDELDAGCARMRRAGPVALLEMTRPRRLNAEDDHLLEALELCVDVALLDPRIEVLSLRGGTVTGGRHAGRRIFCSGLDLTELHEGRLSYAYFVRRELGLVSKLYRGLSSDGTRPAIEKPCVMVVDGHAIGGGLQLLLVADHVVAEEQAWLSLPARREGIIPGAANLRLPRLLGERSARRAILGDAVIPVDGPEGRMLVDEVLPPSDLDRAADAAAMELTSSGLVSVAANRRALRIGQEPSDVFRAYMAHFALAQAQCYFSPQLADNLRRHWVARRPAAPDR
jgi:thioesterase DpgC